MIRQAIKRPCFKLHTVREEPIKENGLQVELTSDKPDYNFMLHAALGRQVRMTAFGHNLQKQIKVSYFMLPMRSPPRRSAFRYSLVIIKKQTESLCYEVSYWGVI